jgi:uridine kinase
MTKPYFIGITGGTASGKTFVIEALKDYFSGHILIVSQDQYYRDSDVKSLDRWERLNLDEPDAFKNELLVEHLRLLKDGKSVEAPVYNYTTHHQEEAKIELEPKPIIIVEGILIFNIPAIRKLCNWRVYLDASPDIRLARRLIRDVEERGIDTAKIQADIKRYMNVVKPMHDKYIEPTKKYAQTVYNTDQGSIDAAKDIIERVRKILKKYRINIESKAIKKDEYEF